MMQPQHDAVGEDLGVQLDPLIGAPAVGVPHHVAGGFGDRELELA